MSNVNDDVVPRAWQSWRTAGLMVVFACVLVGSVALGRWMRESPNERVLPTASSVSAGLQRQLDQGELLYHVNCAKCHGPRGHGDPEALSRLQPPPRDFASRPWRHERNEASIRRVIRQGIANTAMPASHDQFSETELAALAEHVLKLSDVPTITEAELSPGQQSLVDLGWLILHEEQPSPELILESMDEETVRLSELRGRPVLVSFWSTDCLPCLKALPALAELADEGSAGGLAVLSIYLGEADPEHVEEMADEIAPGLPVYLDATGLASHRYDVNSLPSYWLIDRAGSRVARISGAVDWRSSTVRAAIREWSAEVDPGA